MSMLIDITLLQWLTQDLALLNGNTIHHPFYFVNSVVMREYHFSCAFYITMQVYSIIYVF